MKCWIDADEWYPVFHLWPAEEEGGIEVPDEIYARYVSAYDEFMAVQQIIRDIDLASRSD